MLCCCCRLVVVAVVFIRALSVLLYAIVNYNFFDCIQYSGGSSPLGSSPSPTSSPSAAMHPISLSLLHSTSSSSSTSFYSAPGASPLKRSRHNNNNNNNTMEEWLPSPGQMSVDSMSPPPPPSSSSMSMRGAEQQANATTTTTTNGHSTIQPPSVISSSNGYSPSPMSTGSYEPPFSPGGGTAGKLGQYTTPSTVD